MNQAQARTESVGKWWKYSNEWQKTKERNIVKHKRENYEKKINLTQTQRDTKKCWIKIKAETGKKGEEENYKVYRATKEWIWILQNKNVGNKDNYHVFANIIRNHTRAW